MTNYQTEFPDFDLDVAIPAAWDDSSWHNDACRLGMQVSRKRDTE